MLKNTHTNRLTSFIYPKRKITRRQWHVLTAAIVAANCMILQHLPAQQAAAKPVAGDLERNFLNPSDSARPGVYWYFMDGNLNGKEMTADLEAMKAGGLGNLAFLEVDVGIPKGAVRWMTEPWQDLFVKTVRDAERLGIYITLGIGPGWCVSGGPWVKPEQFMQHLIFSSVEPKRPQNYSAILPVPAQRSTQFHKMPSPFCEDVAVLAIPSRKPIIADINREGLVLGNGDLSGRLWQRNGELCIRATKNDVWDARVDTSNDPPMMRVDIPNQKWSGGTGSPQGWNNGYPTPRCAAIIRIGKDAVAGGGHHSLHRQERVYAR
ncbi:MAG: glycosyl hydrolase [Verrucomicrobia bacterium]|nr:glycosyl hydrolase [Verrucomicrobiota bacterium]